MLVACQAKAVVKSSCLSVIHHAENSWSPFTNVKPNSFQEMKEVLLVPLLLMLQVKVVVNIFG